MVLNAFVTHSHINRHKIMTTNYSAFIKQFCIRPNFTNHAFLYLPLISAKPQLNHLWFHLDDLSFDDTQTSQ
jgi:hypothetical protein